MPCYAPDSFDVITCIHVLEHLNDPLAALRQMHQWLKPEGVLMIEVPNMQGYDLKEFERFHFAHVLGFSRANLMQALESTGFSLLYEDADTAFGVVRQGHATGMPFTYDLATTASDNRASYGGAFAPMAYIRYHIQRARRLLGHRKPAAP